MLSPKELQRIGRRLYGNDWQSPLGRALKVHRITIWRWFTGKIEIPEEIALHLKKLSGK